MITKTTINEWLDDMIENSPLLEDGAGEERRRRKQPLEAVNNCELFIAV